MRAKKQPLRRYYSSKGTGIDIWSYYKDGLEVFREIDSNFNGKKDQYRWLNGAGILQVSPSSPYVGLTSSLEAGQDEPGRFYPTGHRTFA